MEFIVYEMVGNFTRRMADFDTRDEASEYVMDRALEDVKEAHNIDSIVDIEQNTLNMELENMLSYYSIEDGRYHHEQ